MAPTPSIGTDEHLSSPNLGTDGAGDELMHSGTHALFPNGSSLSLFTGALIARRGLDLAGEGMGIRFYRLGEGKSAGSAFDSGAIPLARSSRTLFRSRGGEEDVVRGAHMACTTNTAADCVQGHRTRPWPTC
jgi:hypothetical protein